MYELERESCICINRYDIKKLPEAEVQRLLLQVHIEYWDAVA